MSELTLGEFEQLVLLAVLRLGDGAYGAAITQEIETTGREVSVSAVHTTLDRLEQKGLVGTIKASKELVEQAPNEVWDALEEVIKNG